MTDMLRLAASSLWARKRRLAGMCVAIVLGVAFLVGTLVLGDTIAANFDRLFTETSAGTSVVVRNATSVVDDDPGAIRGPIPAAVLDTVAAVDGVKAKVALAAGQSVEVASPRPLSQGAAITVVVRPQKLFVGSVAAGNRLSGRVVSTSYLGGSAIYEIDLGGKTIVRANNAISGRLAHEGEAVEVGFDPAGCVLLDDKGRRLA